MNDDIELKGGNEKDMEVQISTREKHLQQCPFCDEKPSGFGIGALTYNFKTHLDKHLRNKEISQEDFDLAMKRLTQSIPKVIK